MQAYNTNGQDMSDVSRLDVSDVSDVSAFQFFHKSPSPNCTNCTKFGAVECLLAYGANALWLSMRGYVAKDQVVPCRSNSSMATLYNLYSLISLIAWWNPR